MQTRIESIITDVRGGMIPAEIYAAPDVFELELERVFARTWCFLAHESEIPDPGDYVVREIARDSFIVARDESGQLAVHLNMCLHRGVQLCRADRGNASHFRCPYHAWTYKNSGEVVGIPQHRKAYSGDEGLSKASSSLVPAPRFDTYQGLIFASLDPDAPDLEDYLGEFRTILDVYVSQSPSGARFRGPQRWRVPANWKIAQENFAGDSYHTVYTHASVVDVELFGPSKRARRKLATTYVAGAGSGTTHRFESGVGSLVDKLMSIGYPREMAERMEGHFSPSQVALIDDAEVMPSASGCMPNLALIHTFVRIEEDGPDVPFTSVRLWQPISATETEVLSWFIVDQEAPPEFVEQSYRAYVMCFGPSGVFEQDDIENWASITRAAQGQMAKRLKLNNRMGLREHDDAVHTPVNPDWPMSGPAYLGYGEFGQRHFLSQWAGLMSSTSPSDDRRDPTIGMQNRETDPAATAVEPTRSAS